MKAKEMGEDGERPCWGHEKMIHLLLAHRLFIKKGLLRYTGWQASVAQWYSNGFVNRWSEVRLLSLAPFSPVLPEIHQVRAGIDRHFGLAPVDIRERLRDFSPGAHLLHVVMEERPDHGVLGIEEDTLGMGRRR